MTFVLGDVNDAELVHELVGGVDAVVHAAAESHVDRSIDEVRGFLQTNLMGTQVVLEAVRAAGVRMLMISTDEVYGQGAIDGGLFDEDAPVAPRSPYALSKAAADLLVSRVPDDLRRGRDGGPRHQRLRTAPDRARRPDLHDLPRSKGCRCPCTAPGNSVASSSMCRTGRAPR